MRIYRLDSFRLYALVLIIIGHIGFYGNLDPNFFLTRVVKTSVCLVGRFAIPFFVIISGLFVGGKIAQEPSKSIHYALHYTKRLAFALIFWWIIYAVEQPQYVLDLLHNDPVRLIFEGSRVHLWFLISLILTIWVFAIWPRKEKIKTFIIFGGLLYLIGLLGGAYRVTPIGIDINFNTRNGLFFTTLFFAIGASFSSNFPKVSLKTALLIAAFGLILSIVEGIVLRQLWGMPITENDYLLGTSLYGIGVFFVVFALPDTKLDKKIGKYGSYMIGIYCSHMLFIDLFRPLSPTIYPLIWQFLFPTLVAAGTLLLSLSLSKSYFRKAVT
jgi:hypothetical protein